MFDPIDDIKAFHEKFQLTYQGPPRLLSEDLAEFRGHFLKEEVIEYLEATDKGDLHGQLDALVDLVYVALGTAYLQGFTKFEEAWRRVHTANMKKISGRSNRSENDVIKPPGWQPPDLTDLLT